MRNVTVGIAGVGPVSPALGLALLEGGALDWRRIDVMRSTPGRGLFAVAPRTTEDAIATVCSIPSIRNFNAIGSRSP